VSAEAGTALETFSKTPGFLVVLLANTRRMSDRAAPEYSLTLASSLQSSACVRHHLHPDMRYAAIPPFLAAAMISAAAEAHIRLDVPKGRYLNDAQQNTKQKQGPCGVTNDTRTAKADLITTFEPGEMITVEWTETINHPGHFRIAFSEKGQVFPAPTLDPMPVSAQILADDITDDKSGGAFSHDVTLPNVSCDTCTLQLIQVMSDSGDYYFQCADLVLKAGGAGGTSGTGGTSTAGKGGQGSGGKATAGAGGKASTGGTLGAGGTSAGGRSGGSGGTLSASGGSSLVPPLAGSGGASSTGGSKATGGTGTGGTPATPATGGTPAATGGAATTPPAGAGPSAPEEEGGCGLRAPRGNTALALLAISSAAALLRRRRVKSSARR
jgi:hypothetical protein